CFGATPEPARETRALPSRAAIGDVDLIGERTNYAFWVCSRLSPVKPRSYWARSRCANTDMAAEVKKEIELEIAHVLFTDTVGYSKLPSHQQRAVVERLNEIVRGTDEFQAAETAGRLITIPTGDGITLVFYHSPEAPVECALEINRALKKHPELQLRMGIHSGPVSGVIDAAGKANVAGAGINMAQRVMDCAAMPDTSCSQSTWLKISRNILIGSRTCMN